MSSVWCGSRSCTEHCEHHSVKARL